MKLSVNPFPEVNYLISKTHNLATRFLYGSEWYEKLCKRVNAFSGAHGEWVNICLDLNGNRISSSQSLL